ncbi:MAG TPA: gamma-glutamyltransferase family protein [Kofleriaceae bacterium]|nr:gamma-glutamyltransferase family protein [Kofleriaceae bacterium]
MDRITRRDLLVGIGGASAVGALACSAHPAVRGTGSGGGGAPDGRASGRGMVASSQVPATEAGVSILRAGGNAADAAIAVAAALNVTEPTSTGLGGDCFALYYDGATRAVTALNGSGRAPARLTLDLLRSQGMRELPPFHAHTVTVPGACAGWCDLIERHGSLPMATILAPAIRLAEEGFPVGENTAYFWARGLDRQGAAANIRELSIDGRAPRGGERFRNPGLARALRAVAAGGKEAFYRGEIGAAIVRVLQESGGVMSAADLASHQSTWDEPISTTYRGVRVWECPPNGQGITALLGLNILEGFDLEALDPLGPDRLHILVEAMRLAFADTRWYVADPRLTRVPVAELLSKDYAARRRALIDPERATADVRRGSPVAGTDTVYFCVVDGRGNACSFINSNYMGFGTGIVPRGWGFTLQNRGYGFSLDPSHPNALAPGKRPYHTIIPGMMTRADGSLFGPFGVMGGFMQPQGHVQVVVDMLDDGLAPQAALDRPRFCIEPVDGAAKVELEEGIAPATAEALTARGHAIVAGVTGYERSLFGRGQIIRRDADGSLVAGSDRRADGRAGGT